MQFILYLLGIILVGQIVVGIIKVIFDLSMRLNIWAKKSDLGPTRWLKKNVPLAWGILSTLGRATVTAMATFFKILGAYFIIFIVGKNALYFIGLAGSEWAREIAWQLDGYSIMFWANLVHIAVFSLIVGLVVQGAKEARRWRVRPRSQTEHQPDVREASMTGGSSSVVAAAAPPAITEPPAGGATDQAFVAAAATAGTDGTSTNLAKVNNQAGRTYTLALADDGRLIRCTNAETITVTVPAQSSVAWPAGAVVHIEQGGAGTVTVAGARGVTVNSRDGMDSTVGQHSVATLMRVAEDTWTLTGDIE